MSVCKEGRKCLCFQCDQTSCEHYQSEEPEWVKDAEEYLLLHLDEAIRILKQKEEGEG